MIQNAFLQIINNYTDQTTAVRLWEELAAAYSGDQRHYHNLKHLENMCQQLTLVKEEIENWETTILALCYHDAVYHSLEKDNEEQSAKLATQRLQEIKVPQQKIDQVVQLILATKDHQMREDKDANLFTDADLSILGASESDYDIYAKAVRKEYKLVPDALYNPGRKKVLQHFLAMPNIFKTATFWKKYEAQARINLKRELDNI